MSVPIPPKPQYTAEQAIQDLATHYTLAKQLAELRNREAALRRMLAQYFVPSPHEGTNSVPLNDGSGMGVFVGHKVTRKVDKEALSSLTAELEEAGIDLRELVSWTPSLSITAYRALDDEQRALFDNCLDITDDGLPALEVRPYAEPRNDDTKPRGRKGRKKRGDVAPAVPPPPKAKRQRKPKAAAAAVPPPPKPARKRAAAKKAAVQKAPAKRAAKKAPAKKAPARRARR